MKNGSTVTLTLDELLAVAPALSFAISAAREAGEQGRENWELWLRSYLRNTRTAGPFAMVEAMAGSDTLDDLVGLLAERYRTARRAARSRQKLFASTEW